MAKTAREHLATDKKEKKVIMEYDFAGIKKGQRMYVSTPKIVNEFMKTIPYGEISSIADFRQALADANDCDVACPVSTSIFIRLSSQAALDDLDDGKSISDITPFWRLITSKDKIAKKLSVDTQWIDLQRELEE